MGRGGSDDEETTALESELSQLGLTAVVPLPLAVSGQRGPKEPEEQSWRTWARSVSNLRT